MQRELFYRDLTKFWIDFINVFPKGCSIKNDSYLEDAKKSMESKGFKDIVDFWETFLDYNKNKYHEVCLCYYEDLGPCLMFFSSDALIGNFNLSVLSATMIMQIFAENNVLLMD